MKKQNKTPNPVKLNIESYSEYTPNELINIISGAIESLPKSHKNPRIEFNLDYSDCYYEGETPSLRVLLHYE